MRSILLVVMLIAASPAMAGIAFAPYEFTADNGTVVKAQWGRLKVPLRHEGKNGRTITLSFVRFKSTNPHPGYPIVYLAGGPGGSGIDAARGNRFPLFMALRKVADVIALDQRGTGASDAIPSCSAAKPFPLDMTRGIVTAYVTEAVRHCLALWQGKGIDISAYNTRENALDLETLREGLGVKKLNLWGISYGSTLALAALKLMPNRIDRVVLASPLGMNQTVRLPARTQDFLERLDALLKSDPGLKNVYPDLLGTMKAVLDGLATKPVQVTLQPPKGKPVTLALSKFDVQNVTMDMLKDPDTLRLMPIAYDLMAAGQFQPIVAPLYESLAVPFSVDGMALGVRGASCLSPARERLVESQAKTALLGNALNFYTTIIRNAGIKRLDASFCRPVQSDVPALVLTGTLDGRTYPAGHAEILNGLSNGSEVVIENAGHDLFMSSPKVTADIVDFLSHRPVEYRHIELPIPAFVTPAEMKARPSN